MPPHRFLMLRLSAMMGLQYASLGLWAVTVNTYIDRNTGDSGLGIFGSGFVGLAATAGAIGALLSPVAMGVIADRYFSTEKLLAALHTVCVLCLVVMAWRRDQLVFYLALLVYFQAYAPTATLTNSLALRHLPDDDRQFPIVRAIGTAGWVVAGVFIGYVWPNFTGESIEATVAPLQIAAVAQGLLVGYCLTLPKTPALGATTVGWRSLVGGAELWRNRPFLIFMAVSFLAAAPTQFYNSFANPFLNQTGFQHAAAKLTLGQVTEVICMMLLPVLMMRFGLKRLFLIGAAAWAARFAMFAYCQDQNAWLAYPAIIIHGACYTFVYMTGQLYADRLADREARGAAQGLHMLATSGFGHLIGAFIARAAQATYLTPKGVTPPPYDWPSFWLVPLVISAAATVAFAIFFSDESANRRNDNR